MNEKELLKQVQDIFHEEIHDYKFNSEGGSNFVIEINNEWIFRFIREEFYQSQFQLEKVFLPKVFLPKVLRLFHLIFGIGKRIKY